LIEVDEMIPMASAAETSCTLYTKHLRSIYCYRIILLEIVIRGCFKTLFNNEVHLLADQAAAFLSS